MTRFILLAIVLGLVHATAGATVPNPSAEVADPAEPGRPAGWTSDAWGGVSARFEWRRGARDGQRLLRVDVTAASPPGDAKWLSGRFQVAAGTGAYLVSDWYRSNVESHLTLVVEDTTGRRRKYIDVAKLPASDAWTEAKRHVRVPTWAATLRVMHRIARTGWLETDRFLAERSSGQGPHPAIVSLTFDDGWRSAFDHLLPQVEAMGWRSTHYLVSGSIDDPRHASHHLTSDEVRELLARGHEVGSHTSMHRDLARMSHPEMVEDLMESKAALRALGAQVTSVAPPFGSYTEAVREQASRHYAALRTVSGGGVEQVPYRTHDLSALDVTYDLPLERIESHLDEAEFLPGGWLILVFHRAAVDPKHTAPTFITPEKFQAVLDLLRTRGAIVKPLGEVLGLWMPPPARSAAATNEPATSRAPLTAAGRRPE